MAEPNARIFQEMRDADALRAEMRHTILDKAQERLGTLYDSRLAQEMVSGVQDAYRRGIEQGWFGKDVFDGRWETERPDPLTQDAPGMAQGYGQQFYGGEQAHDQDDDLELN